MNTLEKSEIIKNDKIMPIDNINENNSDLLLEINKAKQRIQEKETHLQKLNLLKKNLSDSSDQGPLHKSIAIWTDVCLKALEDFYNYLVDKNSFPSNNSITDNRNIIIEKLGLDSSILKVNPQKETFEIVES